MNTLKTIKEYVILSIRKRKSNSKPEKSMGAGEFLPTKCWYSGSFFLPAPFIKLVKEFCSSGKSFSIKNRWYSVILKKERPGVDQRSSDSSYGIYGQKRQQNLAFGKYDNLRPVKANFLFLITLIKFLLSSNEGLPRYAGRTLSKITKRCV